MNDLIAKLIDYVNGTSTRKKIGDAVGVLVIGFVASILYSAYMAQGEILQALKNRVAVIKISEDEAKRSIDANWSSLSQHGVKGLVVCSVDLNRNLVELLASKSTDDEEDNIKRFYATPVQFVHSDGKGAAFSAALLEGEPFDMEIDVTAFKVYALLMPIPNARRTVLVGYASAVWHLDNKPDRFQVAKVQSILADISDELSH